MKQRLNRFNFRLRNWLQVLYHQNRRLLIILGLFALGGIILGIIVIFNPLLNHLWISNHLLDSNVLNVASPNRSLWTFIFMRLLDFGFAFLLVLLFNLTKWTMLLTFPYVTFRAFWMIINLFWIIDLFGFLHGLLFFLTYLIVFTVLIVIFMSACIFALKRGKTARQFGIRCGFKWSEIRGTLLALLISLSLVALFEWLLYFLLLSRMVYMITF